MTKNANIELDVDLDIKPLIINLIYLKRIDLLETRTPYLVHDYSNMVVHVL